MKKRKPSSSRIAPSTAGTAGRVAEMATLPYSARYTHWIAASDFKAQCLELMDQVRDRHESLVITKYGVPVAKLVPMDERPPDIVGFMRGSVLAYGDLIAPIGEPWDAER